MNLSKLIQIINEEIQQWYDDEPSIVDRYYQNKGITMSPQNSREEKPKLSGELIGYVTKAWTAPLKQPVAIYKNPRNLTGFPTTARGVLVNSGDVYIGQTEEALHYNILELLAKEGIVPYDSVVPNYGQTMPEEYITVIRMMGTNRFTQSPDAYKEFPEYYIQMFDLANTMHPYKFQVI